jgi:hypothetical protein
MTAEEIRARLEEKLIQLAPVLLRLNDELLSPLIDRVRDDVARGLIPTPPPELQASRSRSSSSPCSTRRSSSWRSAASSGWPGSSNMFGSSAPDAIEKANVDKWIDEYSKTLGPDARLVLSDEEVAPGARRAQAEAKDAALDGAGGAGRRRRGAEARHRPMMTRTRR